MFRLILAFIRYCVYVIPINYLCQYNRIINVLYRLAMSLGHICCPDPFPGSRTLPSRFRSCQLWGSFHVGMKYPELWSIYFLLIFRDQSLGRTTGLWPWWSNPPLCAMSDWNEQPQETRWFYGVKYQTCVHWPYYVGTVPFPLHIGGHTSCIESNK